MVAAQGMRAGDGFAACIQDLRLERGGVDVGEEPGALEEEGLREQGAGMVAGVEGDEAVTAQSGQADGAGDGVRIRRRGPVLGTHVVKPQFVAGQNRSRRRHDLGQVVCARTNPRRTDEGAALAQPLPVVQVAAAGQLDVVEAIGVFIDVAAVVEECGHAEVEPS